MKRNSLNKNILFLLAGSFFIQAPVALAGAAHKDTIEIQVPGAKNKRIVYKVGNILSNVELAEVALDRSGPHLKIFRLDDKALRAELLKLIVEHFGRVRVFPKENDSSTDVYITTGERHPMTKAEAAQILKAIDDFMKSLMESGKIRMMRSEMLTF